MSEQGSSVYDEHYRPQFHFTAKQNWLNDPNGLVFYAGEYHLFFQHNPSGLDWGNMTWGHAVSHDLFHWKQLPDAIRPYALGTVYSGSAVVDWDNTAGFQTGKDKTIAALYTAAGGTSELSKGRPFTQCLAYSTDRGRTWSKYVNNPVLDHIVGENRDPKVVWYAPTRRWIMVLYLEANDFAFFSSPDLKHWTRLQKLTVPGCDECPDFFRMPVADEPGETRWVWTAANGQYLVGSFDGERFTPENGPRVVEYGWSCYAVQTFSDIPASDGRRIQIGWMRGGSYPGMPFNQQMTVPCELTLRRFADGLRLCKQPAREIHVLHKRGVHTHHKEVFPSESILNDVKGDLFDIAADVEMVDARQFGIEVQGQAITYDVNKAELSCLGRSAPLKPVDNHVHLRILVDRTSIEVYGNHGEVALSSCFLKPEREQTMSFFTRGGSVKIESLNVFPTESAWKSNETPAR